ncbi:MAG: diaminopimelate decarboxylase [Bacillota bacterium]|nr:diaminopimelate decarboxylase [Bacillota bacterium]
MPNFNLSDSVFEGALKRFPTPFYLYDEAGIVKTVRDVQSAFSWNKGFKEYYAVKALPNPEILKILMKEGCGLDCSSYTELLMAQKLGAQGEDIMFSANAMPAFELAFAAKLKATINLDDRSDVELLHQNGGVPDLLSLRVNPGSEGKGHNNIMGGALDAKFGWMPSQIKEGLMTLKNLGLKRFGLHAMTVSNTLNRDPWVHSASYLFHLGAELEKETGLKLDFINLSGGLGIPYKPEDKAVDIQKIGEEVRKAYQSAFGGRQDVRLFTELGRFVTGPHGFLVARAIHKKEIWRDYIGLDACAANLMRPAIYGAYHHITVLNKKDAPKDKVYDVTGALCENNDKFAVNRALPEIKIGDVLVIHDAGAHGHSMGYQYNGRLRSAEILYTAEGDYRLIRRAETPEDYFATLNLD